MKASFRNISIVTFLILFLSNYSGAQPQKGEFIQASIGYGMSAPYENYNIIGTGFYAQAEYVYAFRKWIGLRPYAGFVITNPSKNNTDINLTGYSVTSKAILLGGKARICAPIPWVAPFIELGVGASLGSFETNTPSFFKKERGLLMHIPYSLGLALGRNHDVEIAATYYDHPSVEQFSGALAVSFSFPINK
ncbi:hypothetical protein [Mariniflexile sp.]|uniref:hypothetical protein n=1 Tax=Mariniflexile sp. TaxID=1979402 RepID=UPI003568574F